jgi:hypothetical protein
MIDRDAKAFGIPFQALHPRRAKQGQSLALASISVVFVLDLDDGEQHPFEPLDPGRRVRLLGQEGPHRDRRQVRAALRWLQGDWPGAYRQGRLPRGALLARRDQDSRPPRTGWCVSSGHR